MPTPRSSLPKETKSYKILPKQLGKGAYSQVFLAKNTSTNEEVVGKRMNLSQLKELFHNEIGILCDLDHPNIVKYLGHNSIGNSGYIFLEKVQGDNLYNFVQKEYDSGIPENLAMEIFGDILSALDYLHVNFICHHDLKSENVMYDSKNNVAKIIDFGMSIEFGENMMVESTSGSPIYSAPEVLLAQPHDPRSSDIWSLGIILYYMLIGDYPWQNVNSVEDLINLFTTQPLNIPYPQNTSVDIQNLINQILVVDPSKRLTVSEIKNLVEEQDFMSIAS